MGIETGQQCGEGKGGKETLESPLVTTNTNFILLSQPLVCRRRVAGSTASTLRDFYEIRATSTSEFPPRKARPKRCNLQFDSCSLAPCCYESNPRSMVSLPSTQQQLALDAKGGTTNIALLRKLKSREADATGPQEHAQRQRDGSGSEQSRDWGR